MMIIAILVPDFLHPFGDASKLTKSAAFRCCKLTMWPTHHIPRETAVAPSSSVPAPCPRRDLADPGIQVAPLESPVSLCSEKPSWKGKKTTPWRLLWVSTQMDMMIFRFGVIYPVIRQTHLPPWEIYHQKGNANRHLHNEITWDFSREGSARCQCTKRGEKISEKPLAFLGQWTIGWWINICSEKKTIGTSMGIGLQDSTNMLGLQIFHLGGHCGHWSPNGTYWKSINGIMWGNHLYINGDQMR